MLFKRPVADQTTDESRRDADDREEFQLTPRHTFSFASIVSVVGFLALFLAGTRIDIELAGGHHDLWELVSQPRGGSGDTLLYLAQVVAAVLGVALTVVAIVVQLAANRYTPKIIDLFVRDPVNVPTLGLFVVTVLEAIWVGHIRHADFNPRAGIMITLALSTASMLVLLPYFRHVFRFLEPANVVHRIRDEIIADVRRGRRRPSAEACARAQARILNSLDHLFDIVRNSLNNADRTLATEIIFVFRDALARGQEEKPHLPEVWFRVFAHTTTNADFLNFPEPAIERFERERTWLERKIFWQLNLLFSDALGHMRGVCSTIALVTRESAEDALRRGDRSQARLCVRAMNTYIRSGLRGDDVRAVFNVLQQYRLFAEAAVELGERELVHEVFDYFRYYGRAAEAMGMGFVLETVTHDLVLLMKAELAHGVAEPEVEELFDVILSLGLDPEGTPLNAVTRRGVRRSQLVLGIHALAKGREDMARRLAKDMRDEPQPRLASIREEISEAEAEFFEMTERVSSFGFVPPEEKAGIAKFFELIAASKSEPPSAPPRPRDVRSSGRLEGISSGP